MEKEFTQERITRLFTRGNQEQSMNSTIPVIASSVRNDQASTTMTRERFSRRDRLLTGQR